MALINFDLLAELPVAYQAFAPTVDVLPLIPLFFFLLVLFGKRQLGFVKSEVFSSGFFTNQVIY